MQMSSSEFYRKLINRVISKSNDRAFFDMTMDMAHELEWWKSKRPYYNVWPSIADVLLNFNIDSIPFESLLSSPHKHVSIQFPKGGINGVMCVGVSIHDPGYKIGPTELSNGYLFSITEQDVKGEVKTEWAKLGKKPIFEHQTVTSYMNILKESKGLPLGELQKKFKHPISDMQRCAIAVLLLENDPTIIEPDILHDDQRKYDQSINDEQKARLVEKAAKRRGRVGFHVGRSFESTPHFRRPHPAIYWTGKGREVAKIVFRKGCIVHRDTATKSPTGYHGDEQSDIKKN